ncbi:FAD:protein FMN transferase [Abyssisolibacter fermentans]|uniref:FAD:protein FMN transferase n=1 Tax=Abyssisolibacter fermentans TaxID=1766203 RepID=UPI00083245A9|nr:FAD:protein FMN transferase [Abyssisolibacter fermentans]
MKKMTVLIMIISLILCSCVPKQVKKPISKTNLLMGTIVNIELYDDVDDKVFEEIFDRLKDIERKMSVNIEDSEVSKLNKASGNMSVRVSDETYYVVKEGKKYSEISKGNFDISILPLVKLWNIGTDQARIPTKEEIEQKKSLVNYKDIYMDDETKKIELKNKNMALDLGGIAKGYGADEITKILKKHDIKGGIIDLGGNITVYGDKQDGSNWTVGIQNPFEERNNYIGILTVKNQSIVTSGIYERYFEVEGKRYHHILSPFTGYPIENDLGSVTILSDESIKADSLSTSAFALGLEEGMKLLNSIENSEGIFITKDKKIYITDGIKDTFELTDKDFQLIK